MIKKGDLVFLGERFRTRLVFERQSFSAFSISKVIDSSLMKIATKMTISGEGISWLSVWETYDDGLALVVETFKDHTDEMDMEICKLLFNNGNGVRYVRLIQLEHAKMITKHNSNA